MNLQQAAKASLSEIPSDIKPIRNIEGVGINHAAWMLDGIAKGFIDGDKGHRWLGYAQGAIVAWESTNTVNWDMLTLAGMKQINKEASQ